MEVIIQPKKTFNISWKEIWNRRDLLYFFAWKDISLRYKYTSLGILWAVLQPFLTMVVLTIVFKNVSHKFSGNIPYPLFSFIGLLFWNYFLSSLNRISNSLINNQSLITKVYFPRLIIPLSATLTGLIDFFFSFLVFLLLLLYYQKPLTLLGLSMLFPSLILTLFTALGLGLFFSALNVKYRDTKQILPFFTYILFFITPVIYQVRLIPKNYLWIAYLNPMAGIIETTRESFFNQQLLNWPMFGLAAIGSLIILTGGFIFFNRSERKLADII